MKLIIDISEEVYIDILRRSTEIQAEGYTIEGAILNGIPLDDVKVEIEQKAYIDGFEGCAESIEKYLSDENKKRLECLLSALRNSVAIDWGEESEDKG